MVVIQVDFCWPSAQVLLHQFPSQPRTSALLQSVAVFPAFRFAEELENKLNFTSHLNEGQILFFLNVLTLSKP